MIDVSPHLLWSEDAIDHSTAAVEGADNPTARRLEVLIAEATKAGQHRAVLAWFCDAARVILDRTDSKDPDRARLRRVLVLCEQPEIDLRAIDAANTDLEWDNRPTELARSVLCETAGTIGADCALTGWERARRLLLSVEQVTGDGADDAIEGLASAAHRRLFGVQRSEAAS